MMTDVTVAKETMLFFQSLILGAGLSLLYDVLRIIRRETRHQAVAVSLEDVVYFLVCGMVTFGFILKDNSGTGARIYRGWGSDRLDNLPYDRWGSSGTDFCLGI